VRSVTHILALFPFEPALYEKAGVPVTYVGHPLADLIPMDPDKAKARAELRIPAGRRLIAMLPGSRRSELHYMADMLVLTGAPPAAGHAGRAFRRAHRDARHARDVRAGAAAPPGDGPAADS
jgi:lipid-A-disaccharide synthase